MRSSFQRVLGIVAATLVALSLLFIVFGIGQRSIRTPTLLELFGYDGPLWIPFVIAFTALVLGLGLIRIVGPNESSDN